MAYTKEVQGRIRALEQEIKRIKQKAGGSSIIDQRKCTDVARATGHFYSTYQTRVCYLAKAACTGAVEKMRGNIMARYVKETSKLTKEELDNVRSCANEILDVLAKYAMTDGGAPNA